jgi:hypothetical protein
VFDNVYWPSGKAVKKRMTWGDFTQTCKIMHDWLPTGHMRRHITGTAQCPGCLHGDETLRHVLRCQHRLAEERRGALLAALQRAGTKKRVPGRIMNAVCRLIKIEAKGETLEMDDVTDIDDAPLRKAVGQQMEIGLHMMQRGYLAR